MGTRLSSERNMAAFSIGIYSIIKAIQFLMGNLERYQPVLVDGVVLMRVY